MIEAVEVEAIKLPGAGIVNMKLMSMASAFGVPWAEVRARLLARGLTSRPSQSLMANGAMLIQQAPMTENTTT